MATAISRLGALASDFAPYRPMLPYQPMLPSSSSSSSWQPYSKQDDRWLQRSKNQRRKQNKKNPPPQSPFLPPTINNLVVPAPPQPSTFADNNEYLDTWMNTYNPYISSFNSNRINRINKFNYNGNFYNWCMERGLGASAPCA